METKLHIHHHHYVGVQEHILAQVEFLMASGVFEWGSAHGFNSGMTVQTSGSSHLCFKGKPWTWHDSLQFMGKRQQTRRCVNSLRTGSKRTGLVKFFFFFFLHKEESSIQMQHGITLRRVSCLDTPVVSVNSVQIILKIFVFQWHFKIPEKCLILLSPYKVHKSGVFSH